MPKQEKVYLIHYIDHSKCESAILLSVHKTERSAQSKCAELNENEEDSYGYFVVEKDLLD